MPEMGKTVGYRVKLIESTLGTDPQNTLLIAENTSNRVAAEACLIFRIMLKMPKDTALGIVTVQP